MKTLLLTLTYAVGIGELILAGYFWVTNSKSEVRRVISLFAFTLACWVIWTATVVTSGNVEVNRIIYFFGALMVASLLHFACVYPYQLYRFDRVHALLFYIPTALLMILSVFSGAIVEATTLRGYLWLPVGGPAFALYNIFLFAEYAAAATILGLRIKKLDGIHKRNTKIFFTGVLIGGLPAVYVDLFATMLHLPEFNYLIGNLFTAAWLGTVIYLLRKE